MNYIKRLEQEVANLKENLLSIQQENDLLKAYLMGSKFDCGNALDGYVHIKDVLNRLPEVFVDKR